MSFPEQNPLSKARDDLHSLAQEMLFAHFSVGRSIFQPRINVFCGPVVAVKSDCRPSGHDKSHMISIQPHSKSKQVIVFEIHVLSEI